MKTKKNQFGLIASLLLAACLASACSSDVKEPEASSTGGTTSGGNTGNDNTQDTNGTFSLAMSSSTIAIVEGQQATVNVQIQRSEGYDRPVTVAMREIPTPQDDKLTWTFSNTQFNNGNDSATITLNLDYSTLPIQRQSRQLQVFGTDGNNQRAATLNVDIEPTDKPDVYLLAGQSNMVGISKLNAKQALPGQPDAQQERIWQLNVTGNDGENFKSIDSFVDESAIAVPDPRLTPAVDPLHEGFDTRVSGKLGTRIGLGMSFANRAIVDTQADVYLVPAAWSDTGFCVRERAAFQGFLGWNAEPTPSNPKLSGTLLLDRAVARTNLALLETNGILRGILWHQGEADASDIDCAVLYEQNLRAMINAMRSRINPDARGQIARGENSDVPFVVGTMSKGPPYNDPSDEGRLIVDGVHRNIKQVARHTAYVDNDDLVPPDYPCGQADDCIHFGASAYRLMGSRYYDYLLEAAAGQ